MGVERTTYIVETKYVTTDSASRGLGGIDRSARRAARSTFSLRGALASVGGLYAGGRLLGAGNRAFIGFNSQVQQTTISLAAQTQMLKGGSWSKAMDQATGQFEKYQQIAKKSVGETKDFVEMHRMIAPAAMQARLGMKQLTQMTTGATIASQVFGVRADQMALDIQQMLAGNVGLRDRFARMLLSSQGISDHKAFNKMKAGKRASVVMRALNDPALKNAAKELENSFAGVTSTFKDNVQIALGKIGLPLMKAMTKEVQRWNRWIDEHPEKMAKFAREFSGALLTGFNVVKDVAAFIHRNRDVLMAIAKAALVFKGVKGLAGILARFAGAGGGGGGGKLGIVGTGLQIAGAAFTTGAALRMKYDQARRDDKERERSREYFLRQGGQLGALLNGGRGLSAERMAQFRKLRLSGTGEQQVHQAKVVLTEAKRLGLVSGGQIDRRAVLRSRGIEGFGADIMIKKWADVGDEHIAKWAKEFRYIIDAQKILNEQFASQLVAQLSTWEGAKKFGKVLWEQFLKPEDGTPKKNQKPPPNNVTVNIQNVAAPDPDRFVIGLNDALEKELRSPTRAAAALRGGF